MKVVVTGGTGKAGRAVVRDLLEHGYDVLNVDLRHPAEYVSEFLQADLTDFGQAVASLHGADAVVHLGAIPGPAAGNTLLESCPTRADRSAAVQHDCLCCRIRRLYRL